PQACLVLLSPRMFAACSALWTGLVNYYRSLQIGSDAATRFSATCLRRGRPAMRAAQTGLDRIRRPDILTRMGRPGVRDRLLDAAMETLHRYGFNGSGVQDITNAAGVPKGSFYNHFESKVVLCAEALEHYWQQAKSSTLSILLDDSLRPL